ncbi:uncharacterized protein BO87DRAFT_377867 [Aspergillus neoniger CBS 115656]|uniref:Uncharacterized protein n=1 Tax=Aspergillus neoniger (strain CBS 115656) TaxID=1448310 RepID=A0A318Z7L1_ASPNB|nr:hypothetical protein BO87DRAFT_377867 [Aspergillus neoniger CBS 115656]PYH32792.1 hypothetical protein BO87DRAFT_377867 [Aspergillus neoniger CBS 115656]
MPSGYASIVYDDRNTAWWRLYVGQCSSTWRRIVCQHAQQIMKGSTSSLFYFSLWIGNGHRYARFIKLWGFPKDTVNDVWYQACSNLLEALFCKAFRTHHGMLNRLSSEHWANGESSTSGLGWGLNIMSPLVQGNAALTKELRTKANIGPSKAPDPQIQHWAVFNSRQKSATAKQRDMKGSNRAIFHIDFDKALQLALDNDEGIFKMVKDSLQLEQEKLETSEDLAHIPFCGSLTSEVAAILDYAAVSGASDMPMRISSDDDSNQQTLDIPWSLDGCGFTAKNILIWTCDFKNFASIGLRHLGHDILTEPITRKFHETVLATSLAKIVFLCGPQSEKLIRAIVAPSRHTLSLRGFNYPLYRDTVRNRLFICCPPLPAEIWSVSAIHSIKISEALRFAVNFIPSLKHDIRPFFCENSSIVGYILRHARKERLGGEALTADTVDEGVQLWLARKNMAKLEDIREIERIGGSLTRGLLMVFEFSSKKTKK